MTLGYQQPSRADAVILPYVGLAFSIGVATIASSYASFFRHPLPDYTTRYLAYCPLWIGINLLSAIVAMIVKAMKLGKGEGAFWKKLDLALTTLSVSSVVAGIVVLILPALH